jgi:hypothetical protein
MVVTGARVHHDLVLLEPRVTLAGPALVRFEVELRRPDGTRAQAIVKAGAASCQPIGSVPVRMVAVEGGHADDVPAGTELWIVRALPAPPPQRDEVGDRQAEVLAMLSAGDVDEAALHDATTRMRQAGAKQLRARLAADVAADHPMRGAFEALVSAMEAPDDDTRKALALEARETLEHSPQFAQLRRLREQRAAKRRDDDDK